MKLGQRVRRAGRASEGTRAMGINDHDSHDRAETTVKRQGQSTTCLDWSLDRILDTPRAAFGLHMDCTWTATGQNLGYHLGYHGLHRTKSYRVEGVGLGGARDDQGLDFLFFSFLFPFLVSAFLALFGLLYISFILHPLGILHIRVVYLHLYLFYNVEPVQDFQ